MRDFYLPPIARLAGPDPGIAGNERDYRVKPGDGDYWSVSLMAGPGPAICLRRAKGDGEEVSTGFTIFPPPLTFTFRSKRESD